MGVRSRVCCLLHPHSYAAMAAKWKEPPRDALDTLVLGAVDMPSMASVVQTDFMPFDPTVKVLDDKETKTHLTPPQFFFFLLCCALRKQHKGDMN